MDRKKCGLENTLGACEDYLTIDIDHVGHDSLFPKS